MRSNINPISTTGKGKKVGKSRDYQNRSYAKGITRKAKKGKIKTMEF